MGLIPTLKDGHFVVLGEAAVTLKYLCMRKEGIDKKFFPKEGPKKVEIEMIMDWYQNMLCVATSGLIRMIYQKKY